MREGQQTPFGWRSDGCGEKDVLAREQYCTCQSTKVEQHKIDDSMTGTEVSEY